MKTAAICLLALLILAADCAPAAAQSHTRAVRADTADDLRRTRPQPPYTTTSELMQDLDLEPGILHFPLIPTPAVLNDPAAYPEGFGDFYALLKIHASRFGEDDNFTLRIIDRRTNTVLERYVLENERNRFLKAGSADWDRIDRMRREKMRELLDRYEGLGYPRGSLSSTWGRLNQVFEALDRDRPYKSYELRLAKMHGLSALSTELGTVETFNQDWLVSRAGARGRYQFMPDMLRRFGLRQYSLRSRAGSAVYVREERHPLLTMEYAFIIMKAYTNTVGHEIPGLSAYNTGVGNIFNVTRLYLMRERPDPAGSSVFDAYAWAVTDGFDVVRRNTTFRTQSRAYLPSVLSAYRATEHVPIDFSETMQAELVTLKSDAKIYLADLLDKLEGEDLDWTPWEDATLYESFRAFNPHVNLPENTGEGVPSRGNVLLQNPSYARPVRFFLPLGSSSVLEEKELELFDDEATRIFDDRTFSNPAQTGQKSLLDWEYEALVEDIGRFGFTMENRERVFDMAEKMEKLAEERPSPYRRAQSIIASMHARLWSFGPWEKLEDAVSKSAVMNRARYEEQDAGDE